MKTPHAVIVGAGIGGLAAAISLLSRGVGVTVLEKEQAPGGKMRRVFVEGRPFDAGPTVFTMRWVFDELLGAAGQKLDDLVGLDQAEILARHGWTDGSRFDLFADRERAADALGDFAGAAEARRFRAFMTEAKALFDHTGLPFMRSTRTDLPTMMKRTGARGALALLKSRPYTTLWGALARQFRDPRLRQLFGRYATYYGSSPFLCPPNLMLVTHVEQEGVWFVRGGMHELARALAGVVAVLGGEMRYGQTVSNIETDGPARFVVHTDAGGSEQASAVILNTDCAAAATGLLGKTARRALAGKRPAARSLSAVTFATCAKPSGFDLHRHTVFFSDAYREEFDTIFQRHEIPETPTTYICAQDRGDSVPQAEDGRERLFFLINAPAVGDAKPFTSEDIERCERNMTALLARCGLTLEETSTERLATTPTDFNRLFPATGGALYGQASNSWTAFFQRPTARTRVPNLYLAGGSVHPGPGVPTVALSGLNAADCLMEDLASTSRSVPTAMPGGMSTGSATTDATGSPSSR